MMQIYTVDQLWLRGTANEIRSYFAAISAEEMHLPLRQWLMHNLH